jgi:hypothetical protein
MKNTRGKKSRATVPLSWKNIKIILDGKAACCRHRMIPKTDSWESPTYDRTLCKMTLTVIHRFFIYFLADFLWKRNFALPSKIIFIFFNLSVQLTQNHSTHPPGFKNNSLINQAIRQSNCCEISHKFVWYFQRKISPVFHTYACGNNNF